MTISKLYEYMTAKEIPESLLPWNVGELLTDNERDILLNGKISASMFVKRLIEMGIRLNDFLYLLKSCKAPMETYEKAETLSYMNADILTDILEYSGFSTKEYKQMLYSAEKIITKDIVKRIKEANNEYPDYLPSDVNAYEEEEHIESEIPPEPKIAAEPQTTYEEKPDKSGVTDPPMKNISAEDENKPIAEEYEDAQINYAEAAIEDYDDDDNADSLDELNPYAEIEQKAEEKEILESDTKEYFPVGEDAEYDNDGEEEYNEAEDRDGELSEEYEDDEPENKTYHKAAIIFSACFAMVLAALSFAADVLGYTSEAGAARSLLRYAADESDIFNEVYSAYYEEKPGGTLAAAYSVPNSAVFGGYMVALPEDMGVYSTDKYIFAAEKTVVSVYEVKGKNTSVIAELKPPEGAEFVRARVVNGSFTAVYSGENICGVIGYGEKEFVSGQAGTLTSVSDTEYGYALGSVYTPKFTESFAVSQTEQYLPWTASGDNTRCISPVNIIFDSSYEGYSYAVYSVHEEGEVKDGVAVIGDPLYSGAEGGFSALMLSGENAHLIKPDNDNKEKTISDVNLGNVLKYTGGEWGVAAVKTEDGKEVVYIYDSEFQPKTKLTNLSKEVDSLYTASADGRLYLHVMGDGEVILTVNITNISNPSLPTLAAASGIVRNGGALLEEYKDGELILTMLTLSEDGVINKEAEYSKKLSDAPELGKGNTFIITESGRCGAAYNYFDGVSKVSEYVIFGKDIKEELITLFDDKNGFILAAESNNHIYIIYNDKVDIK